LPPTSATTYTPAPSLRAAPTWPSVAVTRTRPCSTPVPDTRARAGASRRCERASRGGARPPEALLGEARALAAPGRHHRGRGWRHLRHRRRRDARAGRRERLRQVHHGPGPLAVGEAHGGRGLVPG